MCTTASIPPNRSSAGAAGASHRPASVMPAARYAVRAPSGSTVAATPAGAVPVRAPSTAFPTASAPDPP
ncbi:hypothetical protein J3S85_14815 [Streptomyces lavenduligriseus]|nr:hypothetical protein J3S85_14815 [Streptomyces lavenduligriseus]